MRLDLPAVGERAAPAVALVIACQMVWIGVSLVRHDLRSLMDLPLSDNEQLRVMRAAAAS